jgi:hypothetical protein
MTARACRVCGCTQDRACSPPCWWVEWDLCSACVDEDGERIFAPRFAPGVGLGFILLAMIGVAIVGVAIAGVAALITMAVLNWNP